MPPEETGIDRRRVLRTTGVAVAAAVGATVPAAASDFEVGDCAHVDTETEVFAEGCPPGDQIGTAVPGTCGFVEAVCDRFGTVYLDAAGGWVDASDLVHC